MYNDPPIPLYGGKTLIERAKEENMKRREKMDNNMSALAKALEDAKQEALAKDADVEPKKKKAYTVWDGWYETSLASGDQTKWLMDNMHLSRTQAKKKIYQYRYLHGLTKSEVKEEKDVEKAEKKTEEKVEVADTGIEAKLELLMKQQEQIKNEIDQYEKLLYDARRRYDEIKKKTDVLCSAMDIMNE